MTRRGYEPRFDIDREYGEKGEETVRKLLGLSADKIEVKRKSYHDSKFYVELEHSPGATGAYRPSGLNTTTATYWAFVIGATGVVVFVPTRLLRRLIERYGRG